MEFEEILKYFLDKIFAPFLAAFGLITNILVMTVYSRSRFKKLPTQNFWRLLSFIDILNVIQIVKHFLKNAFKIQPKLMSQLMCKLVGYLSHLNAISAWLLVFISLERFFSILYPRFSKVLQLKSSQIIACLIIFIFNLLFYAQRFVYDNLFELFNNSVPNNQTNNQIVCSITSTYAGAFLVFKWIDLVVSVLVPFILMFFCSIVLIRSIYLSRKRVLVTNHSLPEKKRLQRDIRFSITTVLLNVIFIAFNLPINIYLIQGSSDLFYFSIVDSLYYSSYVVNFCVYFTVNSIFREEFLLMCRLNLGHKKEMQAKYAPAVHKF